MFSTRSPRSGRPVGAGTGTAPVRPAGRADAAAWLSLRQSLWPDGTAEEHAEDIERYFSGTSGDPLHVLLAEDAAGRPVGLAELSIRPFAEGCRTGRVGYLEGWFVAPEARRQGIGRSLLAAAEEWARAQGCRELASDTQPDNAPGIAAHRAAGFEDVGLIRCFRKDL